MSTTTKSLAGRYLPSMPDRYKTSTFVCPHVLRCFLSFINSYHFYQHHEYLLLPPKSAPEAVSPSLAPNVFRCILFMVNIFIHNMLNKSKAKTKLNEAILDNLGL